MAIGKYKGRDPKTGKLRVGKNIRIKCNGWSHKRGWATGPLLHDAKGKVIKDHAGRLVTTPDSITANFVEPSVLRIVGFGLGTIGDYVVVLQ